MFVANQQPQAIAVQTDSKHVSMSQCKGRVLSISFVWAFFKTVEGRIKIL